MQSNILLILPYKYQSHEITQIPFKYSLNNYFERIELGTILTLQAKSKARLDSFDKVACKYYTHTPVRVGPSHIVFPYKKENLEQCNVVP